MAWLPPTCVTHLACRSPQERWDVQCIPWHRTRIVDPGILGGSYSLLVHHWPGSTMTRTLSKQRQIATLIFSSNDNRQLRWTEKTEVINVWYIRSCKLCGNVGLFGTSHGTERTLSTFISLDYATFLAITHKFWHLLWVIAEGWLYSTIDLTGCWAWREDRGRGDNRYRWPGHHTHFVHTQGLVHTDPASSLPVCDGSLVHNPEREDQEKELVCSMRESIYVCNCRVWGRVCSRSKNKVWGIVHAYKFKNFVGWKPGRVESMALTSVHRSGQVGGA